VPGRVGDATVAVQLVRRSQQGAVRLAPTGAVGSLLDALDLVVAQPGGPADDDVLAPLVLGAAVPPRPQDQQLALAGRQLAGQELAAERQPPAEQSGMAHERGEDVLGRAGAGNAAEQLSL